MITENEVKKVLNEIKVAETEIKVAIDLLNRAKNYLYTTQLDKIDEEYFDENFAYPLNNLKHIDFH